MPWNYLRRWFAPRPGVRRKAASLCRPAVEPLETRAVPATLPAGFAEAGIAFNLQNATAMEQAPNGDLWVLEQTGFVKRFRPGNVNGEIVGNVATLGLNTDGERGLLGIAFDPDYAQNRWVYLYYTATTPFLHNRVSRFTVVTTDPIDYYFAGASTATFDAGKTGRPAQTVIMDLDPLSGATNHNGGAIHFWNRQLFIATGDNANGANAQSLTSLHGKILKINRDGTIPTNNPFVSQTTGKARAIWALGLRNPFTFTFQPVTGKMYINDVGQNSFEEFSHGRARGNYGWPGVEGNQGTPPSGPGLYVAPVYAYSHGSGTFQGFAITGGAFYNPPTRQFPTSYVGDYFFGDFVGNWINVRDAATGNVTRFATGANGVVDLRVAADGTLYYLARGQGTVFRVRFVGP